MHQRDTHSSLSQYMRTSAIVFTRTGRKFTGNSYCGPNITTLRLFSSTQHRRESFLSSSPFSSFSVSMWMQMVIWMVKLSLLYYKIHGQQNTFKHSVWAKWIELKSYLKGFCCIFLLLACSGRLFNMFKWTEIGIRSMSLELNEALFGVVKD